MHDKSLISMSRLLVVDALTHTCEIISLQKCLRVAREVITSTPDGETFGSHCGVRIDEGKARVTNVFHPGTFAVYDRRNGGVCYVRPLE